MAVAEITVAESKDGNPLSTSMTILQELGFQGTTMEIGGDKYRLFQKLSPEVIAVSLPLKYETQFTVKFFIGGTTKFAPQSVDTYRALVKRFQDAFGPEKVKFDRESSTGQTLI